VQYCIHRFMRAHRLFFVSRPSNEFLDEFLSQQRDAPFSYQNAGLTKVTATSEFTSDVYRVQLGHGQDLFTKAKAALNDWAMFQLPWVTIYPPRPPLREGSVVAILARGLGFWVLNASRIVYLIGDAGQIEKYGFAYGTLSAHVEKGEERFSVEWRHNDDSVWFEI